MEEKASLTRKIPPNLTAQIWNIKFTKAKSYKWHKIGQAERLTSKQVKVHVTTNLLASGNPIIDEFSA